MVTTWSVLGLLCLGLCWGTISGGISGRWKDGISRRSSKLDGAMELAKLLKTTSMKSKDSFINNDLEEIQRAIASLMNAQSAWKSVDAATHQVRNAFKNSTSLLSRYQAFCARKSRNKKEAAKLSEYLTVVERGMQVSEVLQAVCARGDERARLLGEAGLEELHEAQLKQGSLSVRIFVLRQTNCSATTVEKQEPDELLVAIVDGDRSLERALSRYIQDLLRHPAQQMDLGEGFEERCAVSVLPTVLKLARTTLSHVEPHLAHRNASLPGLEPNQTLPQYWPKTIRVLGHSTGGAVAAYLTLLLDGMLPCTDSGAGRFSNRVRGFLLGPPPCLSRRMVPQFITSLVCDDDFVSRLQPESWAALVARVAGALRAGAGRKGLTWLAAPQLIKDLSSQASRAMKTRRVARIDGTALRLPGRVFFMKARQLKSGATLQRVDRGNWQEDLLWNLHDIVLAPKMFAHHALEAYIRTLNRL